jgi:hypothetical protein
MKKLSLHLQCLIQILNFETLWAYYTQSNGVLYAKECRKMALQIIYTFMTLLSKKPDLIDYLKGKVCHIDDPDCKYEAIKGLKDFGEGTLEYPYETIFGSKLMLFMFFSTLKGFLLNELKVKKFPIMTITSLEDDYSARVIRWRPHMPRIALLHNPDSLLTEASNTSTIAEVGDIRRSQELMLYAHDSKDFAQRIFNFINVTRNLIAKHAGFFDKFTGDGFIVYFNEAICGDSDLSYKECFLNFIKEEINFAIPFFKDWENSIRKLPISKIGIALGADIGTINFADIMDYLIAVGDAIVWASRMASVAEANEIMVNNLLFSHLNEDINLLFERRQCQSKYGEPFIAQKLMFCDQF